MVCSWFETTSGIHALKEESWDHWGQTADTARRNLRRKIHTSSWWLVLKGFLMWFLQTLGSETGHQGIAAAPSSPRPWDAGFVPFLHRVCAVEDHPYACLSCRRICGLRISNPL